MRGLEINEMGGRGIETRRSLMVRLRERHPPGSGDPPLGGREKGENKHPARRKGLL